jgi:hypothetical protein
VRDPKIVVDQVTVGEFFDPAGIGAGYFAGGSNPIVLNIDAYGISETNAGNPYPSADLQLSNAVDNHRPHFGEVMGDARFTKVISPITGLPYLASLNPDGSPAVMPDLTPLGKAWNAPYTATVSPISGNVAIANNFIAWLVIHAPSTATDDDFTDDGSRASAIGWDSVNASGYNGDGTGPNGITIALGGVNNTTRMVQDGSKRIHFGFTNWGLTKRHFVQRQSEREQLCFHVKDGHGCRGGIRPYRGRWDQYTVEHQPWRELFPRVGHLFFGTQKLRFCPVRW